MQRRSTPKHASNGMRHAVNVLVTVGALALSMPLTIALVSAASGIALGMLWTIYRLVTTSSAAQSSSQEMHRKPRAGSKHRHPHGGLDAVAASEELSTHVRFATPRESADNIRYIEPRKSTQTWSEGGLRIQGQRISMSEAAPPEADGYMMKQQALPELADYSGAVQSQQVHHAGNAQQQQHEQQQRQAPPIASPLPQGRPPRSPGSPAQVRSRSPGPPLPRSPSAAGRSPVPPLPRSPSVASVGSNRAASSAGRSPVPPLPRSPSMASGADRPPRSQSPASPPRSPSAASSPGLMNVSLRRSPTMNSATSDDSGGIIPWNNEPIRSPPASRTSLAQSPYIPPLPLQQAAPSPAAASATASQQGTTGHLTSKELEQHRYAARVSETLIQPPQSAVEVLLQQQRQEQEELERQAAAMMMARAEWAAGQPGGDEEGGEFDDDDNEDDNDGSEGYDSQDDTGDDGSGIDGANGDEQVAGKASSRQQGKRKLKRRKRKKRKKKKPVANPEAMEKLKERKALRRASSKLSLAERPTWSSAMHAEHQLVHREQVETMATEGKTRPTQLTDSVPAQPARKIVKQPSAQSLREKLLGLSSAHGEEHAEEGGAASASSLEPGRGMTHSRSAPRLKRSTSGNSSSSKLKRISTRSLRSMKLSTSSTSLSKVEVIGTPDDDEDNGNNDNINNYDDDTGNSRDDDDDVAGGATLGSGKRQSRGYTVSSDRDADAEYSPAMHPVELPGSPTVTRTGGRGGDAVDVDDEADMIGRLFFSNPSSPK